MGSQEVSSPSFCLKQGHLEVNHRCLRFLSSCVFNICKAELLQVLEPPPVKKIYICSEQLLLQSVLTVFCPPVMPQCAPHHPPGDLLLGVESALWFGQSHLFSSVDKPSFLSPSSQDKCSSTPTSSQHHAE